MKTTSRRASGWPVTWCATRLASGRTGEATGLSSRSCATRWSASPRSTPHSPVICGARGDAVGISTVELDPAKLLDKVLQTLDGRQRPGRRRDAGRARSGARGGQQELTVAAIDLGIATLRRPPVWPSAASRCTCCPRRSGLRRTARTRPDGVFFKRSRRPRHGRRTVELLQGALDQGILYFGICFGNQIFGRALGFGTYKRSTATAGSISPSKTCAPARSRSPRRTTASPSTRP